VLVLELIQVNDEVDFGLLLVVFVVAMNVAAVMTVF